MKVEFVSRNKNGDWYVGYRVKVQRGIRGKSKSKVDELLIVGIPEAKFDAWCKSNGLVVHCNDEVFGL